MAKFASQPPQSTGPIRTTDQATTTYEGAPARMLEPLGELFSQVVNDFVEDTFYESASKRLARLQGLTKTAVAADPGTVAKMAAWARSDANMRSAPVVVACEYAAADGPDARAVVSSVAQRADEPAELLGYWLAVHGRRIPKSVKRGIADAAVRLYHERSMLRYDSARSPLRPADVIELTHPKPKDDQQSALFRYLLDRRHGRDDPSTGGLTVIPAMLALEALPESKRRAVTTDQLRAAGFSWERYSGWVPGGMDAQAWETVIPLMGYAATMRNLRNFEEAGISDTAAQAVIAKLTDPQQIGRSRQLPFRFWSAYKHTSGLRFAYPLEQALNLLVREKVPRFAGRTLVLVDVSGSMQATVSDKSQITRAELAGLFAAAVKAADPTAVDVAAFGTGSVMLDVAGASVLRDMGKIQGINSSDVLGHATNLMPAIGEQYQPDQHNRIVVLTDMQIHPDRPPQMAPYGVFSGGPWDTHTSGLVAPPMTRLPDIPVYLWDVSGYGRVPMITSGQHHMIVGMSDKAFDMINLLESRRSGRWPWGTTAG